MVKNNILRRLSQYLLSCAIIASSFCLISATGCNETLEKADAFVSIQPGGTSFGTGGSNIIYANATPTGVTWTLTATDCTGAACGTISNQTASSVTYNSPITITGNTLTVTITATSNTNTSLSSSVTLTIFPVSVQLTGPANSTVTPLSSALFSASVVGDLTGAGVTWSLSGTDCSGTGSTAANCGTFQSTITQATYTAPPSPALQTISVTATSISYPREIATYVMTVPKLSIYVYTPTILPAAIAGQPYSATVQIVGNQPPYTDTFSNLPTWATATASATGTSFTIAGTPPAGTHGTVYTQVSVADSESPSAQASQSFAITTYTAVATGNNLLNGTYAFYATGWTDAATVNTTYNAIAYIGSFSADGNGNITGGELDVNTPSQGLVSYASLGGTYNIQYGEDSNGNPLPQTQIGLITLVPPGKPPLPITLAVSLGGIQHAAKPSLTTDLATYGNLVEFDDTTGIGANVTANSSGIRAAGPIALQNACVLNSASNTGTGCNGVSPITGNYVFGLVGNTAVSATNVTCYGSGLSCGPISVAGVMTVGSSGGISTGEEDVMVWQKNAPAVAITGGSLLNSGNTDAFGRVTASVKAATTSVMLNWPSDFIIYSVSPQKFYVMSSDPYTTNSLITGTALRQNTADIPSTPFSSTQALVLYENLDSSAAANVSTGPGPGGQLKSNIQVFPVAPTSSTTGTIKTGPQYQNASGTYTAASTQIGSAGNYTYTVASNGRVTVSTTSEPTMYLSDTNTGFGTLSVQATGGVPGLWTIVPQTATALNAGTYNYVTYNPSSQLAPMETGVINIPTGGVPTGPTPATVPVTGYDYTAFGAAGNTFVTGDPILYSGSLTGSLSENAPVTDGIGGIFSHGGTWTSSTPSIANGTPGIILGPPSGNTTSHMQGCGQQTGTEGGGFVISPTSFACVPSGGSFSTVHIFQQ